MSRPGACIKVVSQRLPRQQRTLVSITLWITTISEVRTRIKIASAFLKEYDLRANCMHIPAESILQVQN